MLGPYIRRGAASPRRQPLAPYNDNPWTNRGWREVVPIPKLQDYRFTIKAHGLR